MSSKIMIIMLGSNKILQCIDSMILPVSNDSRARVIPQKGHGTLRICLKGQIIFFDTIIVLAKNIICPSNINNPFFLII